MQASGTDILRPLIDIKGNFRNTLYAIGGKADAELFGRQQLPVLLGQRRAGLG